MKYIFFSFITIVSTSVNAQYTFEFTISNLTEGFANCAIEKENGNFLIAAIQKQDIEYKSDMYLIELSPKGELIQSATINHDTYSYVPIHLSVNSDTINILGSVRNGMGNNHLWYSTFDSMMSPIKETIYFNEPSGLFSVQGVKKISDKRFAIIGYKNITYNYDSFMSIIDNEGEILNYKTYHSDSIYRPTAILEKQDGTGFILKENFNSIVILDNDLSIVNIIPQPYSSSPWFTSPNTIRYFSDSTYLISGGYIDNETQEENIAIRKILNTTDMLDEYIFGTVDTTNVPAIINSIDFVTSDKVYCGGWQRNPPTSPDYSHPFYSELPGWFILSQLNEDLTPNWTRFYGGDAYYSMTGVLATRDGGCLMYGGRYDYTGLEERDIYLLKVGPDGLLTSTEVPEMGTSGITVYPNPATHYMVFDTGVAGQYDLLVFDALGKVVLSQQIPNNRPIDIRHLPASTYTYLLTQKNEIIGQGKWVKE